MLAFLGWNPGTAQEVFSMDQLIDAFSLERVGKAGAKFDFDKTKWFNQQYLRNKTGQELAQLLHQTIPESQAVDAFLLSQTCDLMKERATFLNDLWDNSQFFFRAPMQYDEKVVRKKWKENAPSVLQALALMFKEIDSFTSSNVETEFKSFLEKNNWKLGAVLPLFRLAVTGTGMGPSMFEISQLLGKDEVIIRIEKAIKDIA